MGKEERVIQQKESVNKKIMLVEKNINRKIMERRNKIKINQAKNKG